MSYASVLAAGWLVWLCRCAQVQHDACADGCEQSVSLLQDSFVLRRQEQLQGERENKGNRVNTVKDDGNVSSLFLSDLEGACGSGSTWYSADSRGGSSPLWMDVLPGESKQLYSIGRGVKLMAGKDILTPPSEQFASSPIVSSYLQRSNPGKVRELDAVYLITDEVGTIAQPTTCKSWCQVNLTLSCLNRSIVLNSSDPVYDSVIALNLGEAVSQTYHGPIDIMSTLAFHDPAFLSSDITKIAIPTKTNYVMQWFDILGIPSEKIVEGNVWAKHATVAEWRPHNPSLLQLGWLQSRIWTNTGSVDLASRNKLLVIRRSVRGASNHDSLVLPVATEFASAHKLEVQVHDDRALPSVREQIEMFKSAKMIIAPHGAAETFLVAVAPGACVVEMLKPCFSPDDYARLSVLLGLHYVDMLMGTKSLKYCSYENPINYLTANAPVDGAHLKHSMGKCAKAMNI